MVRSLYSGVTGMKAHQTRLDVIGNNLANVNTFGFKSSSVTFRDVYYQTIRGAAAGDGTRGGITPSQVGYGAQVGSIDLNMTQSINTTTGNPWDLSISGEGYFQVQDANGNICYTRAGKLGYDNNGYLVDSNGNFVLGTNGNPLGQAPGKSRIQMSIPAVAPTKPSWTNVIDNVIYTLTASKESKAGNVSVNFLSSTLPVGVAAQAAVSTTGITITLNSDHTFANIAEVNAAMNEAITIANGGTEHPAGSFELSMEPADKFANGLTGQEICQSVATPALGSLPAPSGWMTQLGFSWGIPSVGDNFKGNGQITNFSIIDNFAVNNNQQHSYTITVKVTVDGTEVDYVGTINAKQMTNSRDLVLKPANGETGDAIYLRCPAEETLLKNSNQGANNGAAYTFTIPTDGTQTFTGNATPTSPSTNLGLTSQAFTLRDGTEGGPQTLQDVSGFKVGADGVISVTHRGKLLELGRVDLVSFMNPSGLEQVGNTYFAETGASGPATPSEAGTGGTGGLVGSALEMSNVDISQEFADMITTQRGFQANSRMITVSDTLLEELINLKR